MDVDGYAKWAPNFVRTQQIRGDFREEGSQSLTHYRDGEFVFEEVMSVSKNNLPYEFLATFGYRYPGGGQYFVKFAMCISFVEVSASKTCVNLYWEYLMQDDVEGCGIRRPSFDQTETVEFDYWLMCLKEYVEQGIGVIIS